MQWQLTRKARVCSLITAASMAGAVHPARAATVYNAIYLQNYPDNTTPPPEFTSASVHYADQVTLGASQPYTINSVTLNVVWTNISAGSQAVLLDFWTGFDQTTGSTNVSAGATNDGNAGFLLPAPTSNGVQQYLLTPSTPIQVPSTSGVTSFAVETTLVDALDQAYSKAIGGCFTGGGVPLTGTDTGFVWIDQGSQSPRLGYFTGAQQISQISSTSPIHTMMSIDSTIINTWRSAASGNWNTSGGWHTSAVPNVTVDAEFNNVTNGFNASAGYAVTVAYASSCHNLYVDSDRLALTFSSAIGASMNVSNSLVVGQPATYGTLVYGYLTLNKSGGTAVAPLLAASAFVGGFGGVGSLTIGNLTNLNVSGGLTINANSSAAVLTGGRLFANSLTLSGSMGGWTSRLDLGNTNLDLANASLATVTDQVAQGYNLSGGGLWNGQGITSSAAAADSTHLTSLGVIQNNQSGAALYSSSTKFENLSPGPGDILVKYTYLGDTNLDGKVDGSDYSRIDSGYLTQATGWFNGDLNYDGTIDGSDYTLIDNAFNRQGTTLTNIVASPTAELAGNPAVPEPASGVLAACTVTRLLLRRRRKETHS